MKLFFYGNCQMRLIYRVLEFLLEPLQYTLIFLNDIDRLDEAHLPIIRTCIKESDLFITTFVPDYKHAEYQTQSHLSMAKASVIVPNIYFFGVKPNIGELAYPDGGRGYEDIWLYKFFMDHSDRSEICPEMIGSYAKNFESLLYSQDPNLSTDVFNLFASQCLASSFGQMTAREDLIQSLCANYSSASPVVISQLLKNVLARHEEPEFFTTDHPSLSLITKIALQILEQTDLRACSRRLEALHDPANRYINTTSTEFLFFGTPIAYRRAIGINDPEPQPYILYKPRFAYEEHAPVSIEQYMHQLMGRIHNSSDHVLEANAAKLEKYEGLSRIYSIAADHNFSAA